MKITAIRPQVKTEDRYSIYIDGKYSFGLSGAALITSQLSVDQEITPERLVELKHTSATDKILQLALALIARRPRSEWEMRHCLKQKGAANQDIEEILNTLSNNGYIDDRKFAQAWVQNRRLLKSVSKKRLRLELSAKRVPASIIDEVMAEDDADELAILRSLIQKKRMQSRYQDDMKLMQYLSRQGFTYDAIRSAMQPDD